MVLEVLAAYAGAGVTFLAVWAGMAHYEWQVRTYGFCGSCGRLLARRRWRWFSVEPRCRCENRVVVFETSVGVFVRGPELDVGREEVAGEAREGVGAVAACEVEAGG